MNNLLKTTILRILLFFYKFKKTYSNFHIFIEYLVQALISSNVFIINKNIHVTDNKVYQLMTWRFGIYNRERFNFIDFLKKYYNDKIYIYSINNNYIKAFIVIEPVELDVNSVLKENEIWCQKCGSSRVNYQECKCGNNAI